MVCTGYDLKSLETLLGTAVGVGFILPVVYQMLVERANKLLSLSRTLLAELETQDDRFAIRDLASVRIVFQSNLRKMESASDIFILVSSLSALCAFSLVILSAYSRVCLTLYSTSFVMLIVSSPVLFCGGLFLWWWDSSRPLYSRCEHYYNQ